MRVRNLITLIVMTAILAMGTTPPAQAEDLYGTSCKKVGQKTKSGVDSFVCTKNGTKQTWQYDITGPFSNRATNKKNSGCVIANYDFNELQALMNRLLTHAYSSEAEGQKMFDKALLLSNALATDALSMPTSPLSLVTMNLSKQVSDLVRGTTDPSVSLPGILLFSGKYLSYCR